eukprot:1159384-Pelagomonas_calceolata.AAC.1
MEHDQTVAQFISPLSNISLMRAFLTSHAFIRTVGISWARMNVSPTRMYKMLGNLGVSNPTTTSVLVCRLDFYGDLWVDQLYSPIHDITPISHDSRNIPLSLALQAIPF